MEEFKFKFKKVLDFQTVQKQCIQRQLSDVQDIINNINTKTNEMLKLMHNKNEEFKEVCREGTDVKTIIMHKAYANSLLTRITQQKRQIERQRYFENELKITLKKQSIEVKKLEKIKESKSIQYKEEEQKKQEQLIEEFVVSSRCRIKKEW